MVKLWIVLGDFRFFFIIKVAYQLIDAEVFSPFLALDEPAVILAGAFTLYEYALYIFLASSTLNFLARRNRSYDNELVAEDKENRDGGIYKA